MRSDVSRAGRHATIGVEALVVENGLVDGCREIVISKILEGLIMITR